MTTTESGSTEYLSCAETAKIVRGALKAAFPGVRLSVRSDTYAGGASVDVRWTDGPNREAVESVVVAGQTDLTDGDAVTVR